MDNKSIKKKRMMGYFIEAAQKIIEDEGIKNVTIRKVADLAGYNSATLYNYFQNLNHLLYFASMKYLMYYIYSLPSYVKSANTATERFLKIWECFLYNSYNSPDIYNTIFFNEFNTISSTMEEYYEIYPEELKVDIDELFPMFLQDSIYDRNSVLLDECVKEGLISESDKDEINEMIILIYRGTLVGFMNRDNILSVHDSVKHNIKHIERLIYKK